MLPKASKDRISIIKNDSLNASTTVGKESVTRGAGRSYGRAAKPACDSGEAGDQQQTPAGEHI